MKSKIQKWGNSLALRIPSSFAEEAKVEEGSNVELLLKNGRLIVVPMKSVPTLKSLLAHVSPENIHNETDTGSRQGGEFW